jgi:hypothetical protein
MDNCNKIKIVYWNANSIQHKIHEFYDLLTSKLIDIACICETHLKPNIIIPSHPDYICIRTDRDGNTSKGGLMIIIKRKIDYKPFILNTKLVENMGIEIKTVTNIKIKIILAYLPGGANNTDIKRHYSSDLKILTNTNRSYFIVGDLNSKHRLWNCSIANPAGTILYNELNRSNFAILHPHDPTYFPGDRRRNPSTIDIILTNHLHQTSLPKTEIMNSDHRAVLFDIIMNSDLSRSKIILQRNYSTANWPKYQRIIESSIASDDLLNHPISSKTEIDEMILKLTSMINHAENKAIPFKIPCRYNLILSTEIKEKIKIRNIFLKRWQRNRFIENKSIVNHLNKEIKEEILELRNLNWNHMLSQIPPKNRGLWEISKFQKNKNKRLIPPLLENGTKYISAKDKAKILSNQFLLASTNPLEKSDPNFTKLVENKVTNYINTVNVEIPDLPTINEISSNIKRLKNNKAPGTDNITNRLLKKLPQNGIMVLRLIIIACLKFAYFPDSWKNAKIVAIGKPGKDPSSANSYRPISLLSSLSKILERVILERINDYISEKKIIPNEQMGFRTGLSSTHQLYKIVNHIKEKLDNKMSTGMILCDVEKAFDRIWHKGLLYKMIKLKFPPYLNKIIFSFLQNRTFHVIVNNTTSDNQQMKFGLPQGSCLSPTLYNIFTHDIVSNISPNCSIGLFADDTCCYSSSELVQPILKSLHSTMSNLSIYFLRWKVNLNNDKCQAIFFTRRRTKELPSSAFKFNNTSINWSNSVKYLGIILDKKVTFKNHFEYCLEKANKTIKMLYPLLNKKSQFNTCNKLMLYKQIIRPAFCYGSPILVNAAKTHVQKLQVIQNKIIKMALNVPWYTRTEEIHSITDIKTINTYLHESSTKFKNKLSTSNQT